MPISREFDPVRKFYKSVYSNPLVPVEGFVPLDLLPDDPNFYPGVGFLIDLSGLGVADVAATTVERTSMVLDQHAEISQGEPVHIALLVSPGSPLERILGEYSSGFAGQSKYRGLLRVRMFTDQDAAGAWLVENQNPAAG